MKKIDRNIVIIQGFIDFVYANLNYLTPPEKATWAIKLASLLAAGIVVPFHQTR